MNIMLSMGVAALLFAPAAQRPSQPDFSGEWILASSTPDTPGAAPAMTVRQPIVRTTVRGEPMDPFFRQLIVDRHWPGGDRSEIFEIGTQGGSVGGVVGSPGSRSQTRQSVNWVGTTLVYTFARWSGPAGEQSPDTQHKEVWQLDAEGGLVITSTDQEGSAPSRTTTLTYRRKDGHDAVD